MLRNMFAISGWLVAVFMGLLNLPAQINSFRKELPEAAEGMGVWAPVDSRFNGDWSLVKTCKADPFDVGDLDPVSLASSPSENTPTPGGSGLDFTLRFDGDAVHGEIMSKGLNEHFAWPEATITGTVYRSKSRIRVIDWIDSKPVTLANVDLSRTADGCLQFKVVDQRGNFFPETALLARQGKNHYQSLPRSGGLIERVMKKAMKDGRIKPPSS